MEGTRKKQTLRDRKWDEVTRGWEEGGMELLFRGYRVSFWRVVSIPEKYFLR